MARVRDPHGDCEPEEVSDWSFDENCLFCCLRREKYKFFWGPLEPEGPGLVDDLVPLHLELA
ncbi:unnamed protein product [Menidia menidia]|uniref:(Atlantic silverside) hypothetical protein n=1 Tax=Menidia menidia TaxID=238744 RepID=A0A8S4BEX3_9TELE|nr:unnamed protein product [Menidia menidia]